MGFLTPYILDRTTGSPALWASCERVLSGLGSVGAGLPSEFQQELAQTLAVVNSYYSNRMEGNPTRIGDIFSAKEGHFAKNAPERNYQLEHMAHIHTAQKMRAVLDKDPRLTPTSEMFLKMLHREFYSQLPSSLRMATTTNGETVPVLPGELRPARVSVGFHHAIEADQVEACLDELEKAYAPLGATHAENLVALAAAHHRFLWIHPFADGNGRVVRLMSEAMTIRSGAWGRGLYSISRGLARRRKDYDAALAAVDAPRWNDLDGRGNLSQKGLLRFCEFFLDVMADQIEFMGKILERRVIQERLTRLLTILRTDKILSVAEAAVVTYLSHAGQMNRGDIRRIAGVESRQANKIGGSLLRKDFVQSDSPKGPLRLKVGKDMVHGLFPEFYE